MYVVFSVLTLPASFHSVLLLLLLLLFFAQVMRQVYWGLQTLFTVGYGELSPRTHGETRFNIVVLFAGSLCYAYIIANSSSLIDNLDVTTLSYKHKMDRIRKLLKAVHLDQDSTLQIESYFQKLWLNQKGRLTTTITNDMPKFLRVELYFNTYPWVIDLPFFKKIPDGVMREILAHMNIVFFQVQKIVWSGPDSFLFLLLCPLNSQLTCTWPFSFFCLQKKEEVVHHNTMMEDLLIVTRGHLVVLYNGVVVEDLYPGSFIGENVFCGEAVFPYDIQAEKDTEIFSLSRLTFTLHPNLTLNP